MKILEKTYAKNYPIFERRQISIGWVPRAAVRNDRKLVGLNQKCVISQSGGSETEIKA